MTSIEWYWLWIGIALAFSVAWINGANNAANAIGSAVGAKAISVRKALWLAALFDLLGSITYGQFVSSTLLKGIVDTSLINSPRIIVIGMSAALFSTALWVIISTLLKVPMSISQAIVGGVLGFGIVIVGVENVNWSKIIEIIASWIYLPFLSIILSITLYKLYVAITRNLTIKRLMVLSASFMFIMLFTTIFLLNVKTLYATDLSFAILNSAIPSLILSLILVAYVRRRVSNDLTHAREYVFRLLLLSSCMAMSFSHGANDVANSAGPLAGILYVYSEGRVPPGSVAIPFYAILLSGIGISIGILTWGYSIIETIGEKITVLTIETAFIAQFSGALTTLIVTRLGLPVSTTVAIVGAITGVGLARGVKNVDYRTLFRIIAMWFIGFPVVAGLTALIMYLGR